MSPAVTTTVSFSPTTATKAWSPPPVEDDVADTVERHDASFDGVAVLLLQVLCQGCVPADVVPLDRQSHGDHMRGRQSVGDRLHDGEVDAVLGQRRVDAVEP